MEETKLRINWERTVNTTYSFKFGSQVIYLYTVLTLVGLCDLVK